MTRNREAMGAGRYYPRDAEALRETLMSLVQHDAPPRPAIAIMAPHGSLPHSGAVAGAVYAGVEVPRTCIVLTTTHSGMGEDAAIMTEGSWVIPTGEIPIHTQLAQRLLVHSPVLKDDDFPHRMEFGVEVQLPFLQYRNPDVQIVPISLKYYTSGDTFESPARWFETTYPKLENIAHGIVSAVQELDEPVLLVLSSDLNHYEDLATTRDKDGKAIAALLDLDAKNLVEQVMKSSISMCGVVPAAVTLLAAKELGATSAELIKYGTSAEASGDELMVVGYASVLLGTRTTNR